MKHLRAINQKARRIEDFLEAAQYSEAAWPDILQAELLALPGWAGLMRRLEENPDLAPHTALPCSLMDFLAVHAPPNRSRQ